MTRARTQQICCEDTPYYHFLKSKKQQVDVLTDREVIDRWLKIYKGPPIISRFIKGKH